MQFRQLTGLATATSQSFSVSHGMDDQPNKWYSMDHMVAGAGGRLVSGVGAGQGHRLVAAGGGRSLAGIRHLGRRRS